MKTTNAVARGIVMPALLLLLLTTTVFFSCKKNAAEIIPPADDMSSIAGMINGQALDGSIIAGTDEENNLDIVFNKGSKYILMQKIPGMPYENADEIKSAILITSKYGIIVKDVTANKVWLFANNDEESLQKFEVIKQSLHCSYVSTIIFGNTVVQAQS